METLLDTGKYSDLVIWCQGKSWNVHCAIVCTKSTFFEKAIDSNFKEAHERKIMLDDDDPAIVEKMLRFLYEGDYDDEREGKATSVDCPAEMYDQDEGSKPKDASRAEEVGPDVEADPEPEIEPEADPEAEPEATPEEELDPATELDYESAEEAALFCNMRVYILADKIDAPALKTMACKKYTTLVDTLWDTRAFITTAELLYENTVDSDQELRAIVANTAQQHVEVLINNEDFMSLLQRYAFLAADVLKSVLSTFIRHRPAPPTPDDQWGFNIHKKGKNSRHR